MTRRHVGRCKTTEPYRSLSIIHTGTHSWWGHCCFRQTVGDISGQWASAHFIFIPTTDSSDLTMPVFHINRVQQAKRKSLSKCQNFVRIVKICPSQSEPKIGFISRCLLVLLVVLGAPSLCHEAFGELLKVPGVFHLNLWLLSEEILKVLQQLDSHVCLLIQTFLLLHQLGPDLWRDTSQQTG